MRGPRFIADLARRGTRRFSDAVSKASPITEETKAHAENLAQLAKYHLEERRSLANSLGEPKIYPFCPKQAMESAIEKEQERNKAKKDFASAETAKTNEAAKESGISR